MMAARNSRTIAAVASGAVTCGDLYRTDTFGYGTPIRSDTHVARIRVASSRAYDFAVIDPRDGRCVGYLSHRCDSSTGGVPKWSAHTDDSNDRIRWRGYFDSPSLAAAEVTGR